MSNKPTVVYILGAGHCGSTLLSLLLNEHTKVVSLGEVTALESLLNGESISTGVSLEHSFWRDVLKCYEENSHKLKNDITVNAPSWSRIRNWGAQTLQGWGSDNEILFRCISEISNQSYIVDSSKFPRRLYLLLKTTDVEVKVIQLVRDCRAVMNSYRRKDRPFLGSLRRIISTHVRGWQIRREFAGTPWQTVYYEELGKNPTETLENDVCEFLDLDYEESMLSFRDQEFVGIGGNRMLEREDRDITLDKRWKNEMSLLDRLGFAVTGGWLNLFYGFGPF